MQAELKKLLTNKDYPDELLILLVDIMVAEDMLYIIDNGAYGFLDNLLRGTGHLGQAPQKPYYSLTCLELVETFLSRFDEKTEIELADRLRFYSQYLNRTPCEIITKLKSLINDYP